MVSATAHPPHGAGRLCRHELRRHLGPWPSPLSWGAATYNLRRNGFETGLTEAQRPLGEANAQLRSRGLLWVRPAWQTLKHWGAEPRAQKDHAAEPAGSQGAPVVPRYGAVLGPARAPLILAAGPGSAHVGSKKGSKKR